MINVLVKLSVRNFGVLEQFEQSASKIMAKYGGRILSAFETRRSDDGTGEEVHLLEFPDEQAFNNYRNDNSLLDLAGLRERAISNAEIKISISLKAYSATPTVPETAS